MSSGGSRVSFSGDQSASAACGREYIRFALDEPGLFAVAFRPCPPELYVPEDPSPYHILSGSLDELDRAGLLAVPRAGVEEYAWVGVHGAAVLLGGARSIRGSATGSSRGPSTWSPTAAGRGPDLNRSTGAGAIRAAWSWSPAQPATPPPVGSNSTQP